MKTVEQIFEELIATIERNAINNKAKIANVKLWANSWREELRQFGVSAQLQHSDQFPDNEGKKFLFEFSFYNEEDRVGVIFIVERDVNSAIKLAKLKLEKEKYFSHKLSKNTLISNELRVHDDEAVGVYEVIYPP